MNSVNNKIDEYFKSERRKTLITISCIALPLSFFLLWFMPPMGEASELTGIVVNLTGVPSEQGDKLFIFVKLKNGKQVRVSIPRITFYKKGRDVNLIQVKPLFFGRTIYKFKNYVNKNT